MLETAKTITKTIARFEEKYTPEPNSGCWLWIGGPKDKKGCSRYGAFWLDGRIYGAHQIAWVLFRGEIPDRMCVLHRCDVTFCVNPDHLFIGSQADNVADCKRKRRHTYGEGQWQAKLTDVNIQHIRRLTAEGRTQASIARRFDVGKSTIRDVTKGRTWRHVN